MSDGRASFLATRNVSRETMARLDIYAGLLEKWSSRINLVSRSTLPELWIRHIADSAQLIDINNLNARDWVDLGSGAGFPGAVIAILAVERGDSTKFTLVESDQRKAAFLRTVSRETDAGFNVVVCRIEDLECQSASIVSARALAPLDKLLDYASRHLASGGTALFPKGAQLTEELETARKSWSFNIEIVPSVTDKEAAILKIGEIERV
ncbi:MAG: 16S rRNA (guanine(527)-N(7))-methyltransferase RsmG [Boseongicola sp.]